MECQDTLFQEVRPPLHLFRLFRLFRLFDQSLTPPMACQASCLVAHVSCRLPRAP